MRRLLALSLLAAGACAREEVPQAEPVEIERLLVHLEAKQSSAADLLPAKTTAKINRAERLVPPLEKVQVDRIDPQIALSVIAG